MYLLFINTINSFIPNLMFFKLSKVLHIVAVELENYNENNTFYRKDRLSKSSVKAAGTRRLFVII